MTQFFLHHMTKGACIQKKENYNQMFKGYRCQYQYKRKKEIKKKKKLGRDQLYEHLNHHKVNPTVQLNGSRF